MKTNITTFLLLSLLFLGTHVFGQVNSLELNPENEKTFTPYMLWRHSGIEGLADFKKNKPHEYLKELWYYSESFYIKRSYVKEGISLNGWQIDVSRFEKERKETDETVILMPGYKDALILLPANKLIYKP